LGKADQFLTTPGQMSAFPCTEQPQPVYNLVGLSRIAFSSERQHLARQPPETQTFENVFMEISAWITWLGLSGRGGHVCRLACRPD
jgi:hypothetical protein